MCLFSGISIMISTSNFCVVKYKARYTTFSVACDYASSHGSRNNVPFPPGSGNVNQESDTENVQENFASD